MLTLKVMSGDGLPDDDARATHHVQGNVANVSFVRREDGSCFARCYVRDEVKTAEVSGFTEHEVLIDVPANAYVMNERGKTITSFSAANPAPGF